MTQIKRDLTESFEVYCLHTLANLQYIDRLTTKILVNKKSSQQKTNFEPNFLSLIDRLTKAHYLLQYKFLQISTAIQISAAIQIFVNFCHNLDFCNTNCCYKFCCNTNFCCNPDCCNTNFCCK